MSQNQYVPPFVPVSAISDASDALAAEDAFLDADDALAAEDGLLDADDALAAEDAADNLVCMYSPWQIGSGAILGGPIAALYFLRANFIAMENNRLAKVTLLYGIPLVVAIFCLSCFLPTRLNVGLTAAYVLGAREFARQFQLSKQAITEDPRYKLASNWRVFSIALICLIVTLAAGNLIDSLLGLFV
jgi:hypothetical protein